MILKKMYVMSLTEACFLRLNSWYVGQGVEGEVVEGNVMVGKIFIFVF